jgi:hypothetical protein
MDVRSVMRFLLAKGFSQAKIHQEVVTVYGTNAVTFQGVRHWYREFETGHMSVTYSPWLGRPSTSFTIQS